MSKGEELKELFTKWKRKQKSIVRSCPVFSITRKSVMLMKSVWDVIVVQVPIVHMKQNVFPFA